MCLDINHVYNNQNNMKEFGRSALNSENNKSDYDFPVRCLCGGSLIDHRPVFDPKGE